MGDDVVEAAELDTDVPQVGSEDAAVREPQGLDEPVACLCLTRRLLDADAFGLRQIPGDGNQVPAACAAQFQ